MKTSLLIVLLLCAQICRATIPHADQTANAANGCDKILSENAREIWTLPNAFDETVRKVGVIVSTPDASTFVIDQNAPGFYRGSIRRILKKFPFTMAKLGFERVGSDSIRVLSDRQINENINHFSHKNLLSGLHVVSVVGGEIPGVLYARYIARGLFPIATNFDTRTHDISVHLIGALLMPRNITEDIQSRFGFLLRLLDDPVLSKSKIYRDRVTKLINHEVDFYDSFTSDFAAFLVESPAELNLRKAIGIYNEFQIANLKSLFKMEPHIIKSLVQRQETWSWGSELSWRQRRRLNAILETSPVAKLNMKTVFDELEQRSEVVSKLFN